MFCLNAVKVFSFKQFKEYFLETYVEMASDKIPEIRI